MLFECGKNAPKATTKAGVLRGFTLDGVHTFHGIKYADAKRFEMPQPVAKWEGVKNADSYGFTCPLMYDDAPGGELRYHHGYWPSDENCQYLNVWTTDMSARKPVMVWIHGGGYSFGSCLELGAVDGDSLCRHGDVVVVTLNHRLNIIGFFDLSAYGEKYKYTANLGMADLVAALQWIKENIAQFGGDPDNVTLFGQSGGGGKIQTLLQMPSAEGLFHKAITQSGFYRVNDLKNAAKALPQAIFDYLGEKDVAMFLIPGELFPELYNGEFLTEEDSAHHRKARYRKVLKDMTDCKHNFVVGLCNDELGYILAENDFFLNEAMPYIEKGHDDMDRDHYEETNSTGPNTGGTILDEMEILIKSTKL